MALPLPAFANVRLRLTAADVRAEIYAKVTSVAADGTFVVRFTSVDPAARADAREALARLIADVPHLITSPPAAPSRSRRRGRRWPAGPLSIWKAAMARRVGSSR